MLEWVTSVSAEAAMKHAVLHFKQTKKASIRTKCPGDQILIGHSILMKQKTPGHQNLQKVKSMAVNKSFA